MDGERRIGAAQPGQKLQRRRGVRPGCRVGGGNLAAVGEAGLQTGAGLAVDEGDLMAVAQQIIGGGDTDNPGAEHGDLHGEFSQLIK